MKYYKCICRAFIYSHNQSLKIHFTPTDKDTKPQLRRHVG